MAPKITLHWLDDSRAHRIAWLLEELGLSYELQVYHRDPKTRLAPPSLQKIHPLGKSPVLTIENEGDEIVLAESGFIMQYLCENFGGEEKGMMPRRWRDGMEGKVCGETEAWRRWMYILHYAEGSLMPLVVTGLIFSQLRGPAVPWFIRPLTSFIANRVASLYLLPNARSNLTFLSRQLDTAPDGGAFLCGAHVTAADLLMSFPVILSKTEFNAGVGAKYWAGGNGVEGEFTKIFDYASGLEKRDAYKRAEKKTEEAERRAAAEAEAASTK